MRKRHAYRPSVDGLEDRVVLSPLAPATAHVKRVRPVRRSPVVHRPKVLAHPRPKLPRWHLPATPPTRLPLNPAPPVNLPPVVTPPTPSQPPSPPSNAPTQTLGTGILSAAQFAGLFGPLAVAPVMGSSFEVGAGTEGTFESQVFEGTGAATGLYAYAYQVQVEGGADGVVSVSIPFDDTPAATRLSGDALNYGYLVVDGAVGKLGAPQGNAGSPVTASLTWRAGAHGTLAVSFSKPLGAGTVSATIVVLADKPPSQQFVTVVGTSPSHEATNLTAVYSPQKGTIAVVPSS